MPKKIDPETEKKIQELQTSEQALQTLILQKQAFQLELNETEEAIEEIKKTKGDVYKIVGQIMIKTSAEESEQEMKNKEQIFKLRIGSIEKQQSQIQQKIDRLRQEIMAKLE